MQLSAPYDDVHTIKLDDESLYVHVHLCTIIAGMHACLRSWSSSMRIATVNRLVHSSMHPGQANGSLATSWLSMFEYIT